MSNGDPQVWTCWNCQSPTNYTMGGWVPHCWRCGAGANGDPPIKGCAGLPPDPPPTTPKAEGGAS